MHALIFKITKQQIHGLHYEGLFGTLKVLFYIIQWNIICAYVGHYPNKKAVYHTI